MRRRVSALIVTAAACSLAGCYYVSLHPLVTADVRVYEPGLVGTWVEAGRDDGSVTFAPVSPQYPTHYDVRISNISAEADSIRLVGELARIDDQLVLDLTLGDNSSQCPILGEDTWAKRVRTRRMSMPSTCCAGPTITRVRSRRWRHRGLGWTVSRHTGSDVPLLAGATIEGRVVVEGKPAAPTTVPAMPPSAGAAVRVSLPPRK